MPKISVITPIYADISQKVDWLDEMIQSVISQTMVDWELIIIDDDSPIPIEPVRVKWGPEPRVRWFENVQNYGPAMTRNTAVGIAKLSESQAILPLDADDVLAGETVLEDMFDIWLMDRTKVIFGNLQQYTRIANSGTFQRGKVFQLPEYTFERAMNLQGIMPVTALHSIECWDAAGGWKPELREGLEDVEYWLAAGKAGCCGQKTNLNVFLYRRQEKSRTYELKHENQKFEDMQLQIKSMHDDVYRGIFPMACCGGKGSQSASPASLDAVVQGIGAGRVTELQGYDDKDKIWIEYNGPKSGNFSILTRSARSLPSSYNILGKGHRFQIHKQHEGVFRDRQRLGFVVNVKDPREQEQPSLPPQSSPRPEPQIVAVPKPQLSTIKTLDQPVAPEQVSIQPAPETIIEPSADTVEYPRELTLGDLEIGPTLRKKLGDVEVAYLANSSPEDLMKIPGIGRKRAKTIIAKAQELIKHT